MNRQFILPTSPKAARLLKLMDENNDEVNFEGLDELAEQDRVTDGQFNHVGITDPTDRKAVQFIIDSDFRAGLPFETGDEGRAQAVLKAALHLAGISSEEMIWLHDLPKHSFLDIIPHRQKVLVINMGRHTDISHLIGRVFPRIICMGSMTVQYTFFGQGKKVSTTDAMGEVLHPLVELSFRNGRYKRTDARAALSMGVFPHLAPINVWNTPKKVKGIEVFKATIE